MRRGFTLVELMIVVVLIGVLASLVVPSYVKSVEEVKKQEAITNLQVTRLGERLYHQDNATYTTTWSDLSTYVDIGFRTQANRNFNYSITSANATAFSARAARTNNASHRVTIDQDGNINVNY
jgi:prepilin-type N-terminal cleavage/methylation domain-containing protein